MPISGSAGPYTLYAPTCAVVYMAAYNIPDGTGGQGFDEFPLPIENYSFQRVTRWNTDLIAYKDLHFELMPRQILQIDEFHLSREWHNSADIAILEAYFDSHKGSTIPFWFTAPDDGQTYAVRFKDDLFEYEISDAVYRKATIVLVAVGDIDNSWNNLMAYPPDETETINPILIATGSLPNATLNGSYSFSLAAANGTPPYTWIQPLGPWGAGGAMPPGITLSSSGVLSGTCEVSGEYTFSVEVTDSGTSTDIYGNVFPQPASAVRSFNLNVLGTPSNPDAGAGSDVGGPASPDTSSGGAAATTPTGSFPRIPRPGRQ